MFIPRVVKRKYNQNEWQSATGHAFKKQRADSDAQLPHAQSHDTTITTTEIPPTIQAITPIPSQDERSDTQNALDETEIKAFSSQQRLANPYNNEPTCTVCGKYGEYINNDTDHDVCSLECKGIDTQTTIPQWPKTAKTDAVKVGHYSIADNVHAKLTNYQEVPDVAYMSKQHIASMLKAHDVVVRGTRVPHPIVSFDQCTQALGKTLVDNIDRMGWSMATSVQRLAVPAALAGRDVHVVAPAGSGKTGAFVIPLLAHCQSLSAMLQYKRRAGPYALILSPTRELCEQIETTVTQLATGLNNTRTALLIGGCSMPNQLHRLRKGAQIIIGTPGRVLDMAMHHGPLIRLRRIRMVVLDEADTLFGPELYKQVRQILAKLSTTVVHQTSYFASALADPDTTKKMTRRLVLPIEILVGQGAADDVDPSLTSVSKLAKQTHVKQTILWVEQPSKVKRLLSLLDDPKYFVAPVIVFVESRLAAEHLMRTMKKRRISSHWRIATFHGDLAQEERSSIVSGMNADEPPWDIVIATDMLARGVHLSRVRLVINYDMAATLQDYMHRIARATPGANQQLGWAITFINHEYKHLFSSLTHLLAAMPPGLVTPLPPQLKQATT